jgi:hypothetical protein
MKSKIVYVDEPEKEDKSKQDFNGLNAVEKIEQIATTSNRLLQSSSQVGNVMSTLMGIQPQTYVPWNTFINGVGIAFIAGVLVGCLLIKK